MHLTPLASCVSTLYKSSAFVEEFVRRTASAMAKISEDFEIVLVDDGSPDDSRALAISMQAEFPQLRVIELSRNFGHHAAILAGLEASKGDFVFLVDSDLEEAPELSLDFYSEMKRLDVDVVFGVHDREGQGALLRLTGNAFWHALRAVSDVDVTPNLANVRMMRRPFVNALLAMPDRSLFIGGMYAWPGFRQHAIEIKRSRRVGPSTYSWGARSKLAFLAATSFSHRPLYGVFLLGTGIMLIAFFVGIALVLNKIANPDAVLDGFTSLMLSIWFLGGMLLGGIGILGFYIALIYDQTRLRARYIVRKEHGAPQ